MTYIGTVADFADQLDFDSSHHFKVQYNKNYSQANKWLLFFIYIRTFTNVWHIVIRFIISLYRIFPLTNYNRLNYFIVDYMQKDVPVEVNAEMATILQSSRFFPHFTIQLLDEHDSSSDATLQVDGSLGWMITFRKHSAVFCCLPSSAMINIFQWSLCKRIKGFTDRLTGFSSLSTATSTLSCWLTNWDPP